MAVEPPFKSALLSDALFDAQQGMSAGISPLLLPKNQLGFLTNGTVRGDFASNRPPYQQLFLNYQKDLQEFVENGLWQCGAFFKDDYGNPFLVAAISGRLFLFTPLGTGFSVSEITIPGDPNPSTIPQAWLWQSEKWLIWNDGQSNPVIYDGSASRRAIQGSAIVGTVSIANTIPALGANVTLVLTSNYTGSFNVLVALYDGATTPSFLGYFQTISAGGTAPAYQVSLTNTSGSAQTVNTGDTVIVPANPGKTNQVGFADATYTVPANGGSVLVGLLFNPIPANLDPPPGSQITMTINGVTTQQVIGTPVAGANSITLSTLPGSPAITFGIGAGIFTLTGVNVPPTNSYPVGKATLGPYSFGVGATQLVTLDTGYSGPNGNTVTINGNTYTINVPNPTPASTNLTLVNISGKPGDPIPISGTKSTVRNVPELPPGRMGVYGLGRNWVSLTDGLHFVASDIVGGTSGTPAFNKRDAVLRFQENTYLAGGGAFPVPSDSGEITAMRFISNLDTALGQGPLMVHTPNVVFSCQAPVDRTVWQSISNPILTESLKPRGGLSQRSTINANSDSLFRTALGIQSLILGRRDFDVWGNTPQSFEVDPVLSQDNAALLGFSSAIEFDNRFLITANPIQGRNGVYHTKLVVLNYDPLSSLRGKQPAVYDGIWDGLTPLQLVTGRFGNSERAFAFCFNPDTGKNELWEILPSVSPQVQDNNLTDIVMDLESAILDFGERNPQTRHFKRLEDGEIYVQDIEGEVTFETFFRPDFDPVWHPWHSWTVTDSPSWQPRMGLGEPPKESDGDTGRLTRDGYFFQFRVKITGHCTFMGGRFLASTQPQPVFQKPLPSANL